MNEASNGQPWQWPEERWRGRVNRIRAGKPLTPR